MQEAMHISTHHRELSAVTGTRHVGAARVAGTGSYLLHSIRDPSAPKDSRNASAVYKTRLAYALSLPHEVCDQIG